jgi:hypothetical protein
MKLGVGSQRQMPPPGHGSVSQAHNLRVGESRDQPNVDTSLVDAVGNNRVHATSDGIMDHKPVLVACSQADKLRQPKSKSPTRCLSRPTLFVRAFAVTQSAAESVSLTKAHTVADGIKDLKPAFIAWNQAEKMR